MQRLSQKRKNRLVRLTKARFLRRLKRRRKPKPTKRKEVIEQIVINPPRLFSLSENYEKTLECLRQLKEEALRPEVLGKRRRISIDLAEIKQISVGAALILAAEIDRWRRVKGIKLSPRRVAYWDENVQQVLSDLQFFSLLGTQDPWAEQNKGRSKEVTVLPLVSCEGINTEMCALIEDHLRVVAVTLKQDPSIYEALTEATYNAVGHAYPKDHKWTYPPLEQRWWATGSWDVGKGLVKLLVYDQGVGIPATLSRSGNWEQIQGIMAKLAPKLAKDHSMLIKAALEVSRTSKPQGLGGGQGLKDIVRPLEYLEGSKVRILSGKGCLEYRQGDDIEIMENNTHLGGTLIEWTIPVKT